MDDQKKIIDYFNSANLLRLIFRWKIPLAGVIILSIMLSSFFSSHWFIKPRYKSFAYLYPINLVKYSGELETEQMLQLFESVEIRNKIIKNFPLATHYNIDSMSRQFRSDLYEVFDENIKFSKTEYNSILLEVYDTDPFFAKQLADSIISFFNQTVKEMHKQRIMELADSKLNQMNEKKKLIDSLQICENEIRQKFGIIDYEKQSEHLTEGYVKLLTETHANTAYIKEIKQKLENLELKGGEFLALNAALNNARSIYFQAKTDYEQLMQEYNKNISYTQIVSAPFAADKKSSPNRTIIVLISSLSTLLFAIISILIFENRKEILKLNESNNQQFDVLKKNNITQ